VSEENESYIKVFEKAINDALIKVETFMSTMDLETGSGMTLAGYRGVYDSYHPRVVKAVAAIRNDLNAVLEILNETEELSLKNYETYTKEHYEPYGEKDLSSYHNKYCIYWYRYNEGYNLTEEDDELEFKYGQFLGKQWERVKVSSIVDKNTGLLTPIVNMRLPTHIGEQVTTIDEEGNTIITTYFPPSPNET
jgi:hypothetical protein